MNKSKGVRGKVRRLTKRSSLRAAADTIGKRMSLMRLKASNSAQSDSGSGSGSGSSSEVGGSSEISSSSNSGSGNIVGGSIGAEAAADIAVENVASLQMSTV